MIDPFTMNHQIEEFYRDDSLDELIDDSEDYWMFSCNSIRDNLTQEEMDLLNEF